MTELEQLAAQLPWRDSVVAPREPSMPPHQYVVVGDLRGDELEACRRIEAIIDTHPDAYLAYFRGYHHPTRYLEAAGLRYWRSRLRGRWFLNRARLDSCEPPRRVDEGAKPEDWGGKAPWWPAAART